MIALVGGALGRGATIDPDASTPISAEPAPAAAAADEDWDAALFAADGIEGEEVLQAAASSGSTHHKRPTGYFLKIICVCIVPAGLKAVNDLSVINSSRVRFIKKLFRGPARGRRDDPGLSRVHVRRTFVQNCPVWNERGHS